MVVSVIIPLGKNDRIANRTFTGAIEVLTVGEGTLSEARNLGAQRAKGTELLFLDADMVLPSGLDLSTLIEHGFDLASAEYHVVDAWDYGLQAWQNFFAAIGSPLGLFGGFIYAKKGVFRDIGGFRNCLSEDIEFGSRAWWKGYKIGQFPFKVFHSRPFHLDVSTRNAVIGNDWSWGV